MDQGSFFQILWLVLIVFSLIPFLRQRRLEFSRLNLMRSIERKRGARLVALIHRQETMSFLGFPISRYIDIEDSEQVLRAIRLTPDDMPIDVILHTPGGLVLAAEQIARALKRHPAKVSVLIPHYAMSGGTLIALAADEILLDENAVLGPVDPQIERYPASSILRVLRDKPIKEIDDQTIILADVAEKAIRQVEDSLVDILRDRLSEEDARDLAKKLSDGRWTHDHPLMCEALQGMGLPVSCQMPEDVYLLMEYYPQPVRKTPSVEFVPVPYKKGKEV
ncbi:MAG: hypothetical protein HPY50_07665 [Firmicutes bacterium]|nr:hypothetical protein [Bacillota bacterium]